MTDDLVKRLRYLAENTLGQIGSGAGTCYEAADLIESLRAKLAERREVFEEYERRWSVQLAIALRERDELRAKLAEAERRAEYWKAELNCANAEAERAKGEPVAFNDEGSGRIRSPNTCASNRRREHAAHPARQGTAMTTMNERYGDGSGPEHIFCEVCGGCLSCHDCESVPEWSAQPDDCPNLKGSHDHD